MIGTKPTWAWISCGNIAPELLNFQCKKLEKPQYMLVMIMGAQIVKKSRSYLRIIGARWIMMQQQH
jgi:hypothetical protein